MPPMPESLGRKVRKRLVPPALRGKPFRRLQREFYQRRFDYPQRNLLTIGQQKSGSTWLEGMLCAIPGYMRWKPNTIKFQRADLRAADLSPPPAGYTVTKVHTPPTPENLSAVHALGRPYVVLLRDLRDICVSWAHYIHITPDHPRHIECKPLSIPQTIDYFIERRLADYCRWQLGWNRDRHPDLGLMVRYEHMLADTSGAFSRVLAHFGITLPEPLVQRIVDAHSFKKVTGRAPGLADNTSFNRKGVAGDWTNHFDDAKREAFKAVAQPALLELGYAENDHW